MTADQEKIRKKSYTIPCASSFRDAVDALARQRRVNVADIARSILLVVPVEVIAAYPDPGGPAPGDRETPVLKTGPAKGRPWRRKPRLQMRLAPGYDLVTVRRALNFALALERGEVAIDVASGEAPAAADNAAAAAVADELERLKTIVSVLSFEPLAGGVSSRSDALHVLGFSPHSVPGQQVLRARFRMLATIHHPDSSYGHTGRMAQLNAAMEILTGRAA